MNDKYVSIGKRIAQERKRLGYTQQQIADLCEVSRVQWGRYEREDSELGGRVLKAFSDLGASVSYILTGEASSTKLVGKFAPKKEVKPSSLSDEEWEMIQMYRKLNSEQQTVLKNTAQVFVKQSGRIDLMFSLVIIFFAFMAWLFGAIANYISSYHSIAESMSYGISALVFWVTAMVLLCIKYWFMNHKYKRKTQ